MPTAVHSTLILPVSPLVKKFLAHHYPIEPFMLYAGEKNFNPFSVFLHAHLTRGQTYLDRRPQRQQPRRLDGLTLELTLGIPNSHYGEQLPPRVCFVFDAFCRQYFVSTMINEVKIRRELGARVDHSIAQFLARYDIDEDIMSLDTAQRYCRRSLASQQVVRLN